MCVYIYLYACIYVYRNNLRFTDESYIVQGNPAKKDQGTLQSESSPEDEDEEDKVHNSLGSGSFI